MMRRTQIYLPKEMHYELSRLAAQKGLSMAELIRKILKICLVKKEQFLEPKNDLDRLAELRISGGPKDLSKNIDNYLYQ